MQVIEGVELLTHVVHVDERGSLVALEEQDGLPFAPRRIFYITVSDPSSERAGHAGTSEELITIMTGSVTVELDNGIRQASLRLVGNQKALWIRPGVWLRLKEFSPGTILLVVSSLTYAESRHFNRPQPLFQEG
ncbi:dTDP-6-deoxy-3,4-keto-hexulose isomerase [Nitrosospira lacus]|uniref:Sugar 3,4-ketoisomerase QdtA cupin domain-containing protein n=1 Tax=Nitrosospira lacus TaxID=1288494 RepID=A0A1W6SLG8_9PROT|nr:FdtA/QdtA family cupin domain-containing protein [Nitrosospira lacus]ARO86640.1 dTDP-6-deoxy-3,4-keto-hexulose isomerase [Nitrosospira lacus]